MKELLYDALVEHIVSNQNNYYRVAYGYVRNKDAALDIVQNSICKALEKYVTIRNPDALRSWFYRIVINESIQYIRQNSREICTSDEAFMEQPYNDPDFEENYTVYNMVAALPEDLKTIIILHYYEDLTIKEISEVTGTNINTVKSKLYSTLKRLNKKMKEGNDEPKIKKQQKNI